MTINKTNHQLWVYIKRCLNCSKNQTHHHKFYSDLQLILSLSISFHILAIDFILALSVSDEDYNVMLMITNKFIKRIQLISEKNIWSTEKWEIVLINKLLLVNWNISIVLLSNRDRKFLFRFWKKIFKVLNIRLIYLTIYHSQIDEVFKQINQMIKIAFRFYINDLNKLQDWQQAMSLMQAALNLTVSSMISYSLNKLAFSINFNMLINLLNQELDKIQNFIIYIDAEKAIKLS